MMSGGNIGKQIVKISDWMDIFVQHTVRVKMVDREEVC